MISSGTCACGRRADSFGGLCDRCVALQSLGLVSSASGEQIESAYLTLVKLWQTDRFQSDPRLKRAAEEKLKEINAAHECLASLSEKQASPSEKQASLLADHKPGSPEAPEEPSQAPQRKTTPFVADPEAEEPEEVRRILRRYQTRRSTVPGALVTSGIVLGTVAVLALVWFSVDAFLSSNQSTSLAWARKKSELSLDLHSTLAHLWPSTEEQKDSKPADANPTQNDSATAQSARGVPAEKGTEEHRKGSGPAAGPQPYITAGLSPTEVLAVLGKPTSSSGEKMLYKGSEIDFQDGRVVGWKIDPKTAPLRVKLWPSAPTVPGLTTFAVGSAKSDVIALQGTPNLFSGNEFGYGSSVVFFENDRVVGWKQDPASVRLKVAP